MPGARTGQAERRFVTFELLKWVGTALSADWMRPSRLLLYTMTTLAVSRPSLRFGGHGRYILRDGVVFTVPPDSARAVWSARRKRRKADTICRMRISWGWFAWALLAGTLCVIIGVGFAPLSVPSVFFWRLAAWMVSAVVYAAHIGYEHFRVRNSSRSIALHVAFGAAVGAFGLAAAAIVHSLVTGTGNLRLLRIALLIWPLITGVPAFVVALVLSTVLARVPRCRAAIPGR
jgi:hypothetical protein